PSETDARTDYNFDPTDPVPTIGGSLSSLTELLPLGSGVADPSFAPAVDRLRQIVEPGGFDQTPGPETFGATPPYLPLRARPDVLVFETEPLAEAVEVTGPISVR